MNNVIDIRFTGRFDRNDILNTIFYRCGIGHDGNRTFYSQNGDGDKEIPYEKVPKYLRDIASDVMRVAENHGYEN